MIKNRFDIRTNTFNTEQTKRENLQNHGEKHQRTNGQLTHCLGFTNILL